MEQAGREAGMLSKGIDDERKAREGGTEEDRPIKCYICQPFFLRYLLFFPLHSVSFSPLLLKSLDTFEALNASQADLFWPVN